MAVSTTSGTHVTANTAVNARSITYTANQLLNALCKIVQRRKLSMDYMHTNFQIISDGLRTWLVLQCLNSVTLEIFDSSDKLVERYDFHADYTVQRGQSGPQQERYETLMSKLLDLMSKHKSLPKDCRYRVFVNTTHDSPSLPKWSKTKARSTDHLKKQSLGKFIGTASLGVTLEFFGS